MNIAMKNKEKKNLPIQQEIEGKVPQNSPLSVRNDITDEECNLIWYLRNIPKDQADDFAKSIRYAYCNNKYKFEFKPVDASEPFDYDEFFKQLVPVRFGDVDFRK